MNGRPVKPLDPSLLLEASRVMNAARPDYANAARLVSDWALENIAKADPDTRAAIIGDAAALRLRVPGQYEQALELLTDIDSPQCPDLDGWLHILRALANGQKYSALRRSDKATQDELKRVSTKIREDLAIAFKLDKTEHKTLKADNERYWKPKDGAAGCEADLQDVYKHDADLKTFLDLPAAADAAGNPAADGSATESRVQPTSKE